MASPVLKWVGGKRQLLDELHARFPAEYNTYHEPMVGGGALFFDIEPAGGTVNDTNPRLVNFYEQVRDQPHELISLLREFQDPETDPNPELEFSEKNRKGKDIKNYYYQQRELFNCRPHGESFDELQEAARLLYLNRTCYNGLYRENQTGGFNVPIGRYENPDWVREDEIRAASDVLESTEILNCDLEYIQNVAKPGDLVYFDPPYEPMSPTASFTDYSSEGFGREDQQRLLDLVKKLADNDVYIILSNSGIMYERYDEAGLYVETEGAIRAINSDEENRDEVEEVIATNVPPEDREKRKQTKLGGY